MAKQFKPVGTLFKESYAVVKRNLAVFLFVSVLFVLDILLFVVVGVGFILLIVPGIILLGRLIIAPYVLLDQNLTPIEALNRTWALTKGHVGVIYVVLLFGLVLAVPNVIPIIGPL